MFNKNVPLCAFLTVCIVTFNVEAVDALNQVSNNEESHLEAFKMLADAVLNAAKIEADRIIEKAKIEAAAEIKISEANIEASKNMALKQQSNGLQSRAWQLDFLQLLNSIRS